MDRIEVHTYVMVEEGRSYTALSQVPPELGRSLLLLNAIGSAVGWLFAKVSLEKVQIFMVESQIFDVECWEVISFFEIFIADDPRKKAN